ncbi:MAG: hypothetical protein IH802_12640 [Nitrospinae bacterium]|nr:hypothetical protein [Nitrospinota bacterium]TDJ51909.1 MAG: hypothetical protein E2O45_01060 [Nitrospina sp.]
MPKIAILIAIALVFFTVSNSFAVEPEIMEVTEFEFIEVTEPEFIKVIEPEFIEVIEPDFLVSFVDSDGLTKRGGQQKSLEQIMCGPSNGLPTPKVCLFVGQ